ncbi:MAG: hypothetical protein J6K13_07980 [Clostridia bacterium]|nr:hypothetical protein [Clostridia bacterium]
MRKIFSLLLAAMMVFTMFSSAVAEETTDLAALLAQLREYNNQEAPAEEAAEAPAEEAAAATAYIMYANADWSAQYWHDGNEYAGVKATTVDVTETGSYTVGLEFEAESAGVAFAALGLKDGEKVFPNHYLKINEIRVNGEAIEVDKGYTSSDDQVETRMNIYNEWVSDLPADARSFDGYVDDANWIIVDKEAFAAVKSIEIDFDLMKYGQDTAYIMFADATWERQYWLDGNDYGGVTVTNATITGPGDYTVGLDFTTTEYGKAAGVAFTALGIKKGENTFPGMMLKINDIRINGESVAFTKGYTSSDDQVETRMNVWNEWVPAVPENDATVRSFDGSVEGASAQIVDRAAFEEVKTYEIDFTLVPITDTAYIMYADSAWTMQYWLDGNEYAGVKATNVTVDGPGTYTVGLEFETPAAGVAFVALGIKTGEKTFPGYFIDVKEIKVNGAAIELGKAYTSSDDKIETRANIMNEWVSDLPADARRADGNLEGAAPIVVSKDALAEVSSIEITFEYIYGEPAVEEGVAPMTEDEKAAAIAADYNAYFGFQTENYIFRNTWDDASYGKDVEDGKWFGQMTGWDGDVAVNYGGTYVDAAVTGNGTYSVSLTTGEMGFGPDTFFRMLNVSTDIPSKAVKEGVITISDVTVKFGEGRTQSMTYVNTSGDYARICLVDEYDSKVGTDVAYTMPGANETIVISFTVSGLAD